MSGEEDDAPPTVEEIEAAAAEGPKHDPFSFKLLTTVQQNQSSNGLRHNDHLRYRQYCSRRLRRLYTNLKFKHGKGRFKAIPFPEDFEDMRFLEIPLVQAERAWSYGMQLKTDNANATVINARWRHHSISRFSKAAQWGRALQAQCKIHGDQRTQMEAEAYCAYLEGVHAAEKENYKEAHEKLMRCKKVCEYLSLASSEEESAFLRAKTQELAPLLRVCKYNMGEIDDEEDEDEGPLHTAISRDLSGLNYRGQGLAIPSEKIKDKLFKCLELTSAMKPTTEPQESSALIEQYGKIAVEFGEVLKEIHNEMIKVGADGQTAEWRKVEAFSRQYSFCINLERNVSLLWNHLLKLDALEDMTNSEARRRCKPEEGVRYCDMLKADLASLAAMPDATEAISTTLAAYTTAVANCRCLFLALCYVSMGKMPEGAALFDMLHSRTEEQELPGSVGDPLERLHVLFGPICEILPTRVSTWRCRVLAQMCAATLPKAAKAAVGAEAGNAGRRAGALSKAATLTAFPPAFRAIPCKPLVFDLAFPAIEAPDFESLLEKKGATDAKGLFGKVAGVAGGLGSRLSGLWGRK